MIKSFRSISHTKYIIKKNNKDKPNNIKKTNTTINTNNNCNCKKINFDIFLNKIKDDCFLMVNKYIKQMEDNLNSKINSFSQQFEIIENKIKNLNDNFKLYDNDLKTFLNNTFIDKKKWDEEFSSINNIINEQNDKIKNNNDNILNLKKNYEMIKKKKKMRII